MDAVVKGMAGRKKLLITGAAGKAGRTIWTHLRDHYDFRLVLRSTVPDDLYEEDEVVRGDVSDYDAMVKAAAGVDVIVHLAIRRWGGMSPEEVAAATLEVDMPGVYNMYEAARINAVPTVIFASTNHVTGMYEKEEIYTRPDMPVRPDSIYGTGKAFGEALGRFYSDWYGIRVLCLRIANFNGKDAPGRYYEPGLSRWLSRRDLADMVWRCIEREEVKFGIFYGVSGGSEKKWDLSNARELLGYEPQDEGSSQAFRAKYRQERR